MRQGDGIIMERTVITGKQLDEERALYHLQHGDVVGCVFAGPADGESAMKEARDIRVRDTRFSLRYPLWHVRGFEMDRSGMDEKTRAAIWYATDGKIRSCLMDGVKAVRECRNIELADCRIHSAEFGWKSDGITLKDTEIESEYLFLDAKKIKLERVKMKGKYSFQYVDGLEITDSELDT